MRTNKMAIVGIALMGAAFGARYFFASLGVGIDLPPSGVVVGAHGYVLPLSFICFWLLLVTGFFLLTIGVYRTRSR
jgi:hypothetical protein